MITIKFNHQGKEPIRINAATVAEAVQRALQEGAALSHAALRYAALSHADLSRANLSYADLCGANLHAANLSRANLHAANLSRADLRGADLSYADLSRANLRGTSLRGASLIGANIDFSCWPLWCGSLDVKIDERLFRQLAYHLMRAGASVDDPEIRELLKSPQLRAVAISFTASMNAAGSSKTKERQTMDQATQRRLYIAKRGLLKERLADAARAASNMWDLTPTEDEMNFGLELIRLIRAVRNLLDIQIAREKETETDHEDA